MMIESQNSVVMTPGRASVDPATKLRRFGRELWRLSVRGVVAVCAIWVTSLYGRALALGQAGCVRRTHARDLFPVNRLNLMGAG